MPFTVAGKPSAILRAPGRRVSHVYRRYFQTFGVKMVRGRASTRRMCRQPSGAVVERETSSRSFCSGLDPLRSRILVEMS